MSYNKSKSPWEEYPHIWKSQSAYFAWLRGVLREGWNTAPQKLEFIKSNRIKIKNPNPRGKVSMVWGGKCEKCEGIFVQKELQVDHIVPAGSLKSWEDVQGFVQRLLGVTGCDMRFLCKPCHNIYSYAYRYDVSLEDAEAALKVIGYMKKPIANIKKILDKHDLPSNNDKARKESLKLLISKGLLK